MSINNNEITIKYFYDNGKLYRLVYEIEDDIASAIPSSLKDALQSSIQEAVNKTLSTNSDTVDSIKWSPTSLSGDLAKLDETLTSEINKVSRTAAKTFFNTLASTKKAPPSTVVVTPGITSIEALCASISSKYLTPTEKAALDAVDEFEDRIAALGEALENKRDPALFDKVANDFSEFLKQPQAIKEICPKNFSKILALFGKISVPKCLTPQAALLQLQPYFANNQEFKDNLKLFVKVTSDLFTEDDDLDDDLDDAINNLCEESIENTNDPEATFNALYRVSPSSRVFQLNKFYGNLESFIKNPTIKTEFTSTALRPTIADKTASAWSIMSDATRDQLIPPADFTRTPGVDDATFDADLTRKINEIKNDIIVDLERLSFTLEFIEGDKRVTVQNFKPDMNLDETERHEAYKKQLKEFFELLEANYNKKDQIKILHCMTQKMLTASNHAIAYDGGQFASAEKPLNQGITVCLDRRSNEIIIMSQSKSLTNLPKNRDDKSDVLKTQDLITAQSMALFKPRRGDPSGCECEFRIKQYKESLLDEPFSSNNTRLSLM